MALPTVVATGNGVYVPIPNVGGNQTLADMLRTWSLTGPNGQLTGTASAATYSWTTAKVVYVSHNAATCDITPPDETDLTSWPVGECRTLIKANGSVNVIGFTALTNVSYNFAAVNTAITTLIGSATVPGIATGVPWWTVYRQSATSYLFFVGG